MPPGRPREFDTERALDHAMELFWRKGYRATTTRDLEATLGVTQSSLYQAFGSKAELLDTVLGRYQSLVDGNLFDPLRDEEDGLASLDRFFARLSEWLSQADERGCLIGRLMAEGVRLDADVEERLAHYRAKLHSALEAALARAAAAGEIPPEMVPSRTEVLVGMVLGLHLALQAGYQPQAQGAMAEGVRAEIARWRRPQGAGPHRHVSAPNV